MVIKDVNFLKRFKFFRTEAYFNLPNILTMSIYFWGGLFFYNLNVSNRPMIPGKDRYFECDKYFQINRSVGKIL